MVGGLADWFAVTALFRQPLGRPIPHTAIIPRNKDRIGDSLATFLQSNFLTPSVVMQRLESVDVAGALGRWLKSPSAGDGRLRRGLSRSEEHTSELQSLMRISYAVFCLKKKTRTNKHPRTRQT